MQQKIHPQECYCGMSKICPTKVEVSCPTVNPWTTQPLHDAKQQPQWASSCCLKCDRNTDITFPQALCIRSLMWSHYLLVHLLCAHVLLCRVC